MGDSINMKIAFKKKSKKPDITGFSYNLTELKI